VEANDTVEQEAVRLHAAEAELPPITNLVPPPDVRSFRVYHYQGTYFVPGAREGWYPTNEKGAKHYLQKTHGIRVGRLRAGDPLKQIDDVMLEIRNFNSVSWVGSCAGKPPQLMSANGKDILILEGPKLIEPVKGDHSIIEDVLFQLLGEEQFEHFKGWSKLGFEDLRKVYYNGKQPRPGQFVALVGPRGCGKNLVQERIITPMFGGRVAKPTKFFNEQTNFNSDLVGAEHWMLSDETPARDMESRRAFGNHIKGVAAIGEVRTEAKFGHPVVLRPFRRGTVSLNDEDENIRTLPEMEESIVDKIMLFKCNVVKLPRASGEEIEKAIAEQLPAWTYHILYEHEIREELKDERFGIKAYHHPAVLEALEKTSLERQFLAEIDRDQPFHCEKSGKWFWQGTAADAQRYLEDLYNSPQAAQRKRLEILIKNSHKSGRRLSDLANKMPARVTRARGKTSNVYSIYAPVGWKPEITEDHTKLRVEEAARGAVRTVVDEAVKEAASRAALDAVNEKVRSAAIDAAKKAATEAAKKAAGKILNGAPKLAAS
jgi:hypothetical protein